MAASISSHISDYVLGQDDSKSGEIARDLYQKNVTLVQVIESLGEFLINPSVEPRKRGTQLMADVLRKLPSDFLMEKEVGHVTTFFLSKLSDHHSIQPFALQGLAAVTAFTAFHDASVIRQVCSEIFKEVQNQTLSQADRRATYTIFLNLLTTHLAALQPMGDNFVCGYIQQMDGEKDPRNLMLAFQCSLFTCRNFPLGAMEEDMFEVNSCYFPIDFVPPPSDPHGITREDLSEALCQVMAATPAFAQYCYPLLLEKLTSDVASAKLDSLKTLCTCLPVYETRHLQEYLGSLSAQLIREVRAEASDDLVAASLQALTAIAAQLSRVPQQLGEFMAETGSNLVHQVESDNLAARLSATRVLCAMAAANAEVCYAVASRIVPAVCTACQKLSQFENHTAFFTEVSSLLQYVADSQNPKIDWSLLRDWRGKLQEMCDRLLANKDPQLQVLGMRGLCALSAWGAIFSAEEISTTVEKMTMRALMADSDSFREESGGALSRVVQQQTQLSDSVIACFAGDMLDNLTHYKDSLRKQVFDNSASLLAFVAVDYTRGEKVCQVLIQLLQSYQSGYEECMVPVSKSLARVLASGHLSPEFLISKALPSILGFLWPGCGSWPEDKQQLHVLVLSGLVEGLRSLLLFHMQTSREVVDTVCGMVIKGDKAGGGDADTCPLKAISWQQSRLVQLLLAVMPCFDVENEAVVDLMLSLLPDLALQTEDEHTHEQACRCLAAVINRMPAGSRLDNSVKKLCTGLTSSLAEQTQDGPDLHNINKTLNLLTWLTKAMVVRGHKLSAELTSQLTGFLSDSLLGPKAAEGFRVIMTPFPDVLCPAVRATVTPTFQQRFLVQNLTPLLSGFQGAQPEVRENYLLAAAGMLTNVPQPVLVTELPQLMPVLASSLKGSNSSLHIQALTALIAGLKHTPELVTSYLSDILPDCLTLATTGAIMRVRILALQCVGEMTHLPASALQPHKTRVIRSLKTAIDDHKRLVRKEAALARSAWFLL